MQGQNLGQLHARYEVGPTHCTIYVALRDYISQMEERLWKPAKKLSAFTTHALSTLLLHCVSLPFPLSSPVI